MRAESLRVLPSFRCVIETPRRAVRKIYRRAQSVRALNVDDGARVESDCNAVIVSERADNVAQGCVRQVDNVSRRCGENVVVALITSDVENIHARAADKCVSRRAGAAPQT